MNDYLHLLLAIDFSEQDDIVVEKAQALAQQYQAKLSVIHVLDNIPMPDTNYGTEIALNQDSGYQLLEAEKAKLLERGRQLAVAQSNLWLVWGIPKQEITRIADREKVDLIVVGSHGRHGLALLLGSTVDRVLDHAPCDVLAVRLAG